MALVAAAGASTVMAAATAPGSSAISSRSSRRIPCSRVPAGGRKTVALSQRNVRKGAQWGEERSSFLGDYCSSFASELESERAPFSDTVPAVDGERKATKRQIAARCFGGYQGRRGRGGGVFFVPLGPGRGEESRGSFARREWERRQRGQQERLREMIEREIQARSEMKEEKKSSGTRRSNNKGSSYEFSLLQELERRLRAEEEKAGAAKATGRASEIAESVDHKEGDGRSTEFGASTYELMKELEKRLRAERQGQSETLNRSMEETEPGERRGGRLMTGNYASLYDMMKEWKQETRERRARLEEQWNARVENPVRKEQRKRGEKEEDLGREEGRRKGPERRQERSETREYERVDNSSGEAVGADTDFKPGSKYPQSDGTVVYLKNEANGAEIYLVGTSHVSSKSVEEVREVINRVKPDFVMVELCRKRYEGMKRSSEQERRNPMAFVEQMRQMLTNGNVGPVGRLIGVGLASFYKLLSYRGFHPGKEFQVAIEEGKKVGAKIVLGDQDIEKTLKQLGQFNLHMSLQDAFKIFGQRMPDDIAQMVNEKASSDDNDLFERMRNRKVVRRFNEEMEKGAPVVYKALMSDRNDEMVKALRNLKGKVVAVVGLAHMDGMEQLWHQANERSLSSGT